MELQFFQAISLYRQRDYEKCLEICNTLLQQLKLPPQHSQDIAMREQIANGTWLLKMQALTQRVYVDDLETNDEGIGKV